MRGKAAQTSQIGLQSLLPLVSRHQDLHEHSPQDEALDVNTVIIQNLDGCHSPAGHHNNGFSSSLLLCPPCLPVHTQAGLGIIAG